MIAALLFVLAFVVMGVIGCLSAKAGQLYERREWEGRRFDRTDPRSQVPLDALNDRMDRLEQAIETIAVEVERLGEGQRFVTKLLTDRTPKVVDTQSVSPAGVWRAGL